MERHVPEDEKSGILFIQGWRLRNQTITQSLGSIANCGRPRYCRKQHLLGAIHSICLIKQRIGVNLPVTSPIKYGLYLKNEHRFHKKTTLLG
jgi:hypothetical protein